MVRGWVCWSSPGSCLSRASTLLQLAPAGAFSSLPGSPLAPARSLVVAVALLAATAADSVSLLGWDYCVWPTLRMVWTKVHKLSWKDATRLVCKHARSGRLLAEQSWLSPCPSRCSARSFASPGFTIRPCALEHIDFPGRPARLGSLWPIRPPCLLALKPAEVVTEMNKGFQAELSAAA